MRDLAGRLKNYRVIVSLLLVFLSTKSYPYFLKKVITYILVVFVSLAYSFETIQYFSIAIGSTPLAWMDDFECEEKSAGSEESGKKLSFSDDLYFDNKHLHGKLLAGPIELSKLGSRHNNNFSSSDYSHEVYSPPKPL